MGGFGKNDLVCVVVFGENGLVLVRIGMIDKGRYEMNAVGFLDVVF